jgi:3-isopropylmalate/(R)-2-methylmalate dehydratase small subunit
MKPLRVLDAVAVPLDESNIDTDQLAPGRFLLGPMHPELFMHDRRFAADGSLRADFVLNDPAYAGAEILVVRRNFGIGSSREYAALSLPAAGFRCVIAVSFGDIFYSNCLQVGVLPIVLEEAAVDALQRRLHDEPGLHVHVELDEQTVGAAGWPSQSFTINAMRKTCLLEGIDETELTERYRGAIDAFEEKYYAAQPWLS